jgi:hypothetical protein
MRKRLIQALIFIAVALGVAVGAAGAAGAIGLHGFANEGISWGWGGASATSTVETARA